jgi:hypothetical protein
LILSQTAGPLVTAGPRQVSIGPLPAPGKPAHVSLAVDSAVGRMCFAALVRDLTDKISGGGDSEVCLQTTRPPFFNGCCFALSGESPRHGLPLGVLALILLRRRRRGHAR